MRPGLRRGKTKLVRLFGGVWDGRQLRVSDTCRGTLTFTLKGQTGSYRVRPDDFASCFYWTPQ